MERRTGYLKLAGGTVYDPTHQVDGEVRDIWVLDGKISGPAPADTDYRTIDVSGRVVMAGAIDMHSHIAGPKVNVARMMQPEMTRQNNDWIDATGEKLATPMAAVPDIYTTGLRYTGLGYTTCFDAAISPLASRHVHHEFEHIPNVDTGFFALVGNNHFIMEAVAKQDATVLREYLGWMLKRVGAYAPKVVNPGGVENWKASREGNARDLDAAVSGFNTTPRKLLESIAQAGNEIGLPHPIHIHCNNLGIPGNWKTTLETMRTMDGMKAHLTHVQFHSYGGGDETESSLCSRVEELANFVNEHPELTVDVGQVMFQRTASMTGDGPLGYYLKQISGEKWYCADTELESGCGVSPIEYKNKNFVHTLQWAIGLEWYLKVRNPWQVVMSTDHPNGGSFVAYPQIIRLLMDSAYRTEVLGRVHPKALQFTELPSLDREYSLSEIAVITRAGPAKILGLKNKGHLGIGADADICIYNPNKNFEEMFAVPWMVFKAGELLVEQYELRQSVSGLTLASNPNVDPGRVASLETWTSEHYSLDARNFGIQPGEFARVLG